MDQGFPKFNDFVTERQKSTSDASTTERTFDTTEQQADELLGFPQLNKYGLGGWTLRPLPRLKDIDAIRALLDETTDQNAPLSDEYVREAFYKFLLHADERINEDETRAYLEILRLFLADRRVLISHMTRSSFEALRRRCIPWLCCSTT